MKKSFLAKVAEAKIEQLSTQANPPLRDYVGHKIVFNRIQITKDIEIRAANLKLDKVTFFLSPDCPENPAGVKALDGFQLAAVQNAIGLAKMIGTPETPDYGPYPIPLRGEIASRQSEDRAEEGKDPIVYVEILEAALEYADPEALKELEGEA